MHLNLGKIFAPIWTPFLLCPCSGELLLETSATALKSSNSEAFVGR